MTKAGATEQQAKLVSDRVISRLGERKQPVPSSQLSSMVARSLSRVNPTASGQYTNFRDQKLRSTVAPTAKGAALLRRTAIPSSVLTQAPLQKVAVSTAKKPSVAIPAIVQAAVIPAEPSTMAAIPQPTQQPATPPAVAPFTVSISPPIATVERNHTQEFVASASGGVSPYHYKWIYRGFQKGIFPTLSINEWQLGTYQLYCEVIDSTHSTVISNYAELRVVDRLQVFTQPTTYCLSNESATLAATASGGAPPYTWEWFEGSTLVGTLATLVVSKSVAGTHGFMCWVTDSAGWRASASAWLIVRAAPLSVSAEPLTASCEVGQSGTFTAIASGGNPPYRYEWFEDTTFTRVGDSAAMSIRKGAGTYKFWCNVTDSTGATNSTNKVELRVIEP